MIEKYIQKVGQIGIPVKKFKKAVGFYKDLLKLPFLFSIDSMTFFDCHGTRLLLSLPEKEDIAQSSSVIYFQVENMKEAYEELWKRAFILLINHT